MYLCRSKLCMFLFHPKCQKTSSGQSTWRASSFTVNYHQSPDLTAAKATGIANNHRATRFMETKRFCLNIQGKWSSQIWYARDFGIDSTGSSLRPWCGIGIIVQSFSTPNGDDDDDDAPVSIFYVFTVCRFLQRKVVISFAKRMSSCCQPQILVDRLNQSSGKYFNIKAFFLLLSHRWGYRIRNCSFWQRRSPWFYIYFRRTELRMFSLGAARYL